MTNPSPDFSFDLYPGLDAELDAAFERNVVMGKAEPGIDVPTGLAVAVQNSLQQVPQSPDVLTPEMHNWAASEVNQSGGNWHALRDQLGVFVPTSINELREESKDLDGVLRHLYEAKEALQVSGQHNPEGLPLEDTMTLVLMPWKAMRDNLGAGHFDGFIQRLRLKQGATNNKDFINDDLHRAIVEGTPIYRDPLVSGGRLSTAEYLDRRIEAEGNWGVALIQTSEQAGIQSLVGQSPDALTNNGTGHIEIGGHQVDGMGVIEWLALTLQTDPTALSKDDYSWMLANRLDVNGDPCVPYGDWDGDQVKSNLRRAGYDDGYTRPRLAVMKNLEP